MKRCQKCGFNKPTSEFSKNRTKKGGRNNVCKVCHRAYYRQYYLRPEVRKRIRKNPRKQNKKVITSHSPASKEYQRHYRFLMEYGITLAEYREILDEQGNRCPICGRDLIDGGLSESSTCIDHDHFTGKVRGILCRVCNRALGQWQDDPILLKSAIDYLEGRGSF